MNEANIGGGGVSPEDSLALAEAIALRSGQHAAIAEQILAGLQGVPYEAKTPEELRRTQMGRTALYLAKVESPEALITWDEMTASVAAGEDYSAMAEKFSADLDMPGVEIGAGDVRDAILGAAGSISKEAGVTDEKMTESFAKTLNAAREVAAENDVSVATVYNSDKLYYEAYRRAFTPNENVSILSDIIDGVSAEMMQDSLLRQLETFLPNELIEELEPGEFEILLATLQLNPEFRATMEQNAELFKESMRQAGTYNFIRTYGEEALSGLSTSQKLTIMPRMPLVPEVFDTLQ